MAIFKDVVVDIKRLTTSLASPNYGLCLILTTQSTAAYKEYSSLDVVKVDFTETTAAYGMAKAIFSQEPAPDKVAIVGIQQEAEFSEVIDGLNQVLAANDGFTFIVSDESQAENITTLAAWATLNKKFYGATISPSTVATVTSPNSDYVFFFVSSKPEEYPEAAIVGACSTYQPGSATWMFKKLVGVTPEVFDDQATMVGLINEKNFITYVTKYGIPMTTGGTLTSGEFIDVMLGILWIKSDMEIRIQKLLASTPKIPYDNGGIALIASQVDSTLREATSRTIVRRNEGNIGEYEIAIPDISQAATEDIAARELKDITWNAKLAGAIHHVEINGVVQY